MAVEDVSRRQRREAGSASGGRNGHAGFQAGPNSRRGESHDETFGYDTDRPKAGVKYRYPNLGWWLVLLAGVTLVCYLGNRLWSRP